MTIATGDAVTVEYTGRTEEGAVFDTTRESVAEEEGLAAAQPDREFEPLTFELGEGRIIEGLEDALVGLEQGATPTVTIPPEQGYGQWSEENVREFETADLREMLGGDNPAEGDFLEAQNGSRGEVVHADDETVRVDFNSPLAGETLEFDIEVVDVS